MIQFKGIFLNPRKIDCFIHSSFLGTFLQNYNEIFFQSQENWKISRNIIKKFNFFYSTNVEHNCGDRTL